MDDSLHLPPSESLPDGLYRQLKLLLRQIWKKTMHASPEFGSIWSLYWEFSTAQAHDLVLYGEYALRFGYEPALRVCEERLAGQHMWRKRAVTLLKMAAVQVGMGQGRKAWQQTLLVDALDACRRLKDKSELIKFEVKVYVAVGDILQQLNLHDSSQAAEYYCKALERIRSFPFGGDSEREWELLLVLGDLYLDTDPVQSLAYYLECKPFVDTPERMLVYLEKLGLLAKERRAIDPLTLLEHIPPPGPADHRWQARFLQEKAKIYDAARMFPQAVETLREAAQQFHLHNSQAEVSEEVAVLQSVLEQMLDNDLPTRLESLVELQHKLDQDPRNCTVAKEIVQTCQLLERCNLSGELSFAEEAARGYDVLMECGTVEEQRMAAFQKGKVCVLQRKAEEAEEALSIYLETCPSDPSELATAYQYLASAYEFQALQPYTTIVSTYERAYTYARKAARRDLELDILSDLLAAAVRQQEERDVALLLERWEKLQRRQDVSVEAKTGEREDVDVEMPFAMDVTATPRSSGAMSPTTTPTTHRSHIKTKTTILPKSWTFLIHMTGLGQGTMKLAVVCESHEFSLSIAGLKRHVEDLVRKRDGVTVRLEDSAQVVVGVQEGELLNAQDLIRPLVVNKVKELQFSLDEVVVPRLEQHFDLLSEEVSFLGPLRSRFLADGIIGSPWTTRRMIVLTLKEIPAIMTLVRYHLQEWDSLRLTQNLLNDTCLHQMLETMNEVGRNWNQVRVLDLSYNCITLDGYQTLVQHLCGSRGGVLEPGGGGGGGLDPCRLVELDLSGGMHPAKGATRAQHWNALDIVAPVLQLPTLQSLRLDRLGLGVITASQQQSSANPWPRWKEAISKNRTLRTLSVRDNHWTTNSLLLFLEASCVYTLPLQHFHMSHAVLGEDHWQHVRKWVALETLDVSECSFSWNLLGQLVLPRAVYLKTVKLSRELVPDFDGAGSGEDRGANLEEVILR